MIHDYGFEIGAHSHLHKAAFNQNPSEFERFEYVCQYIGRYNL